MSDHAYTLMRYVHGMHADGCSLRTETTSSAAVVERHCQPASRVGHVALEEM